MSTRIHGPSDKREPICVFSTHSTWVNKASSWLGRNCAVHPSQYVCVDSVGRICGMGTQFMRARDEKTFPVTVWNIDDVQVITPECRVA